MASSSSETNQSHLPLVLLHRPPDFDPQFFPHLRTLYGVLDPHVESNSDPAVLTLFRSARILICLDLPPVTSETLDRHPSLECVLGTSAGLDHVDLADCRRRGIRVTNSADVFSEDVADYAVGLLVDILRRVSTADQFVRAGYWPVKGDFPLGSKVGGKRVGIVGLGNIGMRISKRLEAFGCIIAYNSRNMKPSFSFPYYASILELATWSDILIVCCSYNNETHHLINKDVMEALGKDGVIINVGRGALIDEKELVQSLIRGEIGGAGLDVFENEPRVPQELYGLDNVVLSPHMAVLTPESFAAIQNLVMTNLEAFFSNKPLCGEIDLNDQTVSCP